MRRLGFALFGLWAAGLGVAVVLTHNAGWWQFVFFAIAPDLTLLAGAAPGLARGQLHPRAVPLYNAVHNFLAPAILVVVAFALHANGWMAGALAWTAHIAFDRSLGFGLRDAAGFQRASGRSAGP